MTDYDHAAREWLAGRLDPSIGWEAWTKQARADADGIQRILAPYRVRTLLEAGSGIGRLTPHLAAYYDHVIAVDTSPGMQECTELACVECVNVSIRDQDEHEPYPVADAAVVFDVINWDWHSEQADELAASLLRSCLLVLVQRVRLAGWAPPQDAITRSGDDWWLLQADVV